MYPIYRDIPNWVILDETIIHDFSVDERAIPVVNVLIGTLCSDKEDSVQTPITRWMTKTQFNNYRK